MISKKYVLSCLCLIAMGAADSPAPPTSGAALSAERRYQAAIDKARKECARATIAADKQRIADLAAVLKTAMIAKDLKEAEQIGAAKPAAEAALKEHSGAEWGDASAYLGKWKIRYTSNVHKTYVINRTGSVEWTEESRTGKLNGGLLEFDDGRLERITPVGDRLLVEHWTVKGSYPNEFPILGIAIRE